MDTHRIAQLSKELLDADPALRGRADEVQALIAELLAQEPAFEPTPAFRARLRQQLRAHAALHRVSRRYVQRWWYAFGGVAAVAIMLVVLVRQPEPQSPMVALYETELTNEQETTESVSDAARTLKAGASVPMAAPAFQLMSEFADDELMHMRFTCDGTDIHPPFAITGVPEGTTTFALIVEDIDAPSGTFTHWVVWNIDATTQNIPEGVTLSGAVEGVNGWGTVGWRGPCPLAGSQHRYTFTLYALARPLTLPEGSSIEGLRRELFNGPVLGETMLTGAYVRDR